jgi:hypothetical protein
MSQYKTIFVIITFFAVAPNMVGTARKMKIQLLMYELVLRHSTHNAGATSRNSGTIARHWYNPILNAVR